MRVLNFRSVVAIWVTVLSALTASTAAYAAVGRTAGTFNVSATGAATYQIPIWVPPGPKGIQPNLALTYNSNAGDGSMGPGWALAGLSAITRCNKTYAQDTAPAAVTLSTTDGYCLNGNRLRQTSTSGSNGLTGPTYQTEMADFSLVVANGTAGGGPASFTVWGKDGLIYEYGTTTDSRIVFNNTASQWLLNKVRDHAGNSYIITYTSGTTADGTSTGSTGIGVPRTISWTPSSYNSGTYNYTVNFAYLSDTAQGSETAYVNGQKIQNTNILSTIAVKSGSTVVRKYTLNYTPSPQTVTARNRLTSITECADDTPNNCLLPTNITYQDGAVGVSSPTVATGINAAPINEMRLVDIDGDGRDDMVYPAVVSADASSKTYRWFVRFASASGFGSAIDTNVAYTSIVYGSDEFVTAPFVFDDFLGEGRTSMLNLQNGACGTSCMWYFLRWNGSAFTNVSTGLAVDPNRPGNGWFSTTPKDFAAADVNGDGLPDLVSARADGTIYTRINASLNGAMSFAGTANQVATVSLSNCNTAWGISLSSGGNNQSAVRHSDFNGDGRGDVSLTCWQMADLGNGYQYFIPYAQLLISSPSGAYTAFSGYSTVIPVNFNDDGCTDVLDSSYTPSSTTTIYTMNISKCNGSSEASSFTLQGSLGAFSLDWNGDGRDDLLTPDSSTGTYLVRLSNGASLNAPISSGLSLSGGYLVTDQDGDGLSDLLKLAYTYSNGIRVVTATYGLHNGVGIQPDLATSIKDGYGVEYKPTYVSITQSNYTKGTGATYPEKDIQTPMYVVSQAAITDASGTTPTYTQSYTYTGARADISGRGFLGFKSQTMIDSRNNAKAQTFYKTAFPYTGMPYRQDQYRAGDFGQPQLISHTVNTPALTTLEASTNNQPCARCFPYIASTSTDIYEGGFVKNSALIAQSSTSFTYDNYGNVTLSTSTVTDKDSTAPQSPTYNQSWTTTVTNTIAANEANWCLGLPTRTVIQKSGTGATETAISRTTDFTPDYAMCRITQKVVEPNSTTYKVTTALGYDSFGNVNSQTVTGINMPARTTTVNWGATGQFPISVTNPLLQLTAAGYDYDKGVQTSQTDPNGLITSWQYDSFGRKILETRPDQTTTTRAYNDCTGISGGCQNGDPASSATGINKMVVTATIKDTSGIVISDQLTYLDQLDRPIITKSKLLSGSYNRVGVQYDALGRKSRETAPCDAASCSTYWNTYFYDTLDRIYQLQRPISASNPTTQTTNVSYQGMTTVTTDSQGKQSTKVTDPNGWMRQTKDANGYAVNFTYDAFGSLNTVVDSASNALFSASYAYGLGAFQTQTVDMDLGTWNYTPDALGEVANYTDAKGSTFTMTYDSLSRPLTRSVPGQTTARWIWGTNAAAREIGQLAKQCMDTSIDCSTAAMKESYLYDGTGRLSQKDILAAGTTYSYNYAYNNVTGLLDTLTYPTSTSGYRLALKYVYQNGLLQQVKDNAASTIFWQATAMNPRGQITQEQLGNGIVTNRSYDAVTGWINSIQSGVGGGYGVQNEAYLFDKVGNVTQRQNNTLGLTESFYYDNVYRLDYSQLNNVTNLDMTYDNLGNITNRSDVASNAAWTYHATKKHAVLQAGSSSNVYTYDANGNAISRNGWTLGWNRSNYLTSISKTGISFNFSYDGNNQRWKQVYSDFIDITTTLYVGGLMEKLTSTNYGTSDWRHYIKVGSQTVAVYSRQSNGTNTLRYVLEDHQGSMAKITDTTGATYVSESFTAFGDRRNPSTWSGAPTSTDLNNINAVTHYGYTGQEALYGTLANLGLNHMNGRVQDAITGRFLSADPYITEPGNTQNYNRYSYVYNNPLSLMDPTGYSSLKTGDYDENGALVIVITKGCCDSLSGSFSGSWGSYAQQMSNLQFSQTIQQNYQASLWNIPSSCSSCTTTPTPPFGNTINEALNRQQEFDKSVQAQMWDSFNRRVSEGQGAHSETGQMVGPPTGTPTTAVSSMLQSASIASDYMSAAIDHGSSLTGKSNIGYSSGRTGMPTQFNRSLANASDKVLSTSLKIGGKLVGGLGVGINLMSSARSFEAGDTKDGIHNGFNAVLGATTLVAPLFLGPVFLAGAGAYFVIDASMQLGGFDQGLWTFVR